MVTLSQFSPYLLILFELRNLEHSLSVSSSLQFLCSWLLLHSLCLWTSASSWSYPGVKRHWLNHWQLPSCLCGASSRCIIRLQPWSQGFFGEFRLEGWRDGGMDSGRPDVRFIKFQLRPILSFRVAPGWPRHQRQKELKSFSVANEGSLSFSVYWIIAVHLPSHWGPVQG